MSVRKTERADDARILAILRTPALQQDMIVLVSGDGERPFRASVAGQRDSDESGPTLRGSNPDSWSLMTTLATPSRTIASPSTFVPGRKAACYNGYIRQKWALRAE